MNQQAVPAILECSPQPLHQTDPVADHHHIAAVPAVKAVPASSLNAQFSKAASASLHQAATAVPPSQASTLQQAVTAVPPHQAYLHQAAKAVPPHQASTLHAQPTAVPAPPKQ